MNNVYTDTTKTYINSIPTQHQTILPKKQALRKELTCSPILQEPQHVVMESGLSAKAEKAAGITANTALHRNNSGFDVSSKCCPISSCPIPHVLALGYLSPSLAVVVNTTIAGRVLC